MAEPWAEALLANRRRDRDALIAKARPFAEALAETGDLVAAVVYGSVARGDFNVWSDIDLLLVVRAGPMELPAPVRELMASAPAGVQVVAWTPQQFRDAYAKGNPIAREALVAGTMLIGEGALHALVGPAAP